MWRGRQGRINWEIWIDIYGLCYVVLRCSVTSDSLQSLALYPPGSFVHRDSPGKNIGVGCHALLQRIFPTQGSNRSLPHCRQILYCLRHQGSPWILEWVVCPFSRGTFWPRNQNRVSCILGGFSTSWATRECLLSAYCLPVTALRTLQILPHLILKTAPHARFYYCLF